MRKIILFLFIISFCFGQTGFVKTPDQLYYSIANKKPKGNELKSDNNLPDKVDLSPYMPIPGYQGKIGSCASWAAGYACKTYQETIELKLDPNNPDNQFSPSFLYNLVNNGENKGSTFPDVFNILSDKGCATFKTMPYTEDISKKPDMKAIEQAKKFKITSYKRLQNGDGLINAIRSSIASGQPVIVAMRIYENFKKLKNEIYDEISGERSGSHGMCVVAYDDNEKIFTLINSWGTKWGSNGYCDISYDIIDELIIEAYVTYDEVKRQESDKLQIPLDLCASEGSYNDHIDLKWKTVKNAEYYQIFRANNKIEELELIKQVNNNNFTDHDVLQNVKYIYSVRAQGNRITSDYSEIACGWTSKEEMGIPTNAKCLVKNNIPYLSWDRVDEAKAYNIYRWNEQDQKYDNIAQSDDELFIDSSVPISNNKITIYYLITAIDEERESKSTNRLRAELEFKSRKEIEDNKNNTSHLYTNDIIIPEHQRKSYDKGWESFDFYDDAFIKAFFEKARKAEEAAFKKLDEQEDKYFEKFKEMENRFK